MIKDDKDTLLSNRIPQPPNDPRAFENQVKPGYRQGTKNRKRG